MPPTLEPPPPQFAPRDRVIGPPSEQDLQFGGTSPELSRPPRWPWFVLGIVIASLSGFLLPRGFTWFLAAIPHEMGHATVGCLLGHPSTPAISLRGEAWTGIAMLRPWLVWVMTIGFAFGAWYMRRRPITCITLGVTAALIPLAAFTMASSILISVGGHAGELAFATYCFMLAWTGGRTDTPQERTACAMAGALLQFVNLKLCFGLMTSPAARDHYAHNGSLGLKNDYLVLAQDLLHWKLPSVAMVMFTVALLPLPLGILIGWWRERVEATE